jgi:uncharacterized protein
VAGSSLLALIDDIASLLDDVSAMTKVAATKTAGVVGDDLAVNAEQVAGVVPDRELGVVWAVAKGSLINKAILVPLSLGISWLYPPLVLILLMFGGAFLCFEGFEKVLHTIAARRGGHEASDETHLKEAALNPEVDLVDFEKTKIRGAIRTDFILSAEIIVISLGTMLDEPIFTRVTALCVVALVMTVFVYGLVAGIVKLDDFGFWLLRRTSVPLRAIGKVLVRGAPFLMKTLAVLGTIAMFLVGGGIVLHGLPALEHWAGAALHFYGASAFLSALAGVATGAVVFALVQLVRRFKPTQAS